MNQAARKKRIARILARGDVKLGSDESLRRHRLPPTVELIEAGRKPADLKQGRLIAEETSPQDAPESTISPRLEI